MKGKQEESVKLSPLFVEILKKYMDLKKITKASICREIGLSRTHVSNFLNGLSATKTTAEKILGFINNYKQMLIPDTILTLVSKMGASKDEIEQTIEGLSKMLSAEHKVLSKRESIKIQMKQYLYSKKKSIGD